MKKDNYLPRIIDSQIEEYLNTFGAICIEGPKWCGKTWSSRIHSKSEILIGDPAENFQNRRTAELSPDLVLSGSVPRMIDEWQEVPSLWDAVRYKVDVTNQKGLFILTGSSTPKRKGILHSGAGRIAKLKMNTMTLYESGRSGGEVSFEDICNGKLNPVVSKDVHIEDLAEYIVRGGWPGGLNLSLKQAQLLPSAYIKAVVDDDIEKIDVIERNKGKMMLLLRSLARNESTTASIQTLQRDIRDVDMEEIHSSTVTEYLDILERLFLIDNQEPFSPNVRSSVRVKQMPKRHFTDTSLACSLLNITPKTLLSDLNTFGLLFEALCVHDLKIYAESFGARLYHYQDYRGKEADAVVELPSGEWCAIEIKLGANQIDEAAASLLKLRKEITADPKGRVPSQLCVVYGLGNLAYKRDDGVMVVPLTALKN